MKSTVLILGIETSCDETAAAVVRRNADGSGSLLSNTVYSQLQDHKPMIRLKSWLRVAVIDLGFDFR